MTYYETLGVERNATAEEIKRVYRIKAALLHPDRENGNTEAFAALGTAYAILSDEAKRAEYDATGTNAPDKKVMMTSTLQRLLFQLLPTYESAGQEMQLVHGMRKYLDDEEQRARRRVAELARLITKRRTLAGKITKRDGDNLLSAFILKDVERMQLEMAATSGAAAEIVELVEMLDGYDMTGPGVIGLLSIV